MDEIVWTANEVSVLVYADDGFGSKSGNVIFEYCYFQNVVVTATLPMNREPVLGRESLKLVAQAYEYEMSVDHWFIQKTREFDVANVFNRSKRLFLEMSMRHAGETPEVHSLKLALANTFSIQLQDNQTAQGSAKFSAELYE
jgi:hypothetical protein